MSSKHKPPPNEDSTTTTSKRPLVQASDSEDSDDSVNWESDNDDDVGAPSADEEENRFSDLQNNAARDLTFKLNPENSAPVEEEKKKAKKKRRKSTTKTRRTLATLARKFPSLIKDSRNLHCSVVLGTVASGMFFSGVASSNEFRARVMSCFPLGGMVLALDSACFERYDDSRKIGSRQDLQFLFDWFCEACCLNNERTKGKSGKKQKKGRYSNIDGSAWSGLFTNLAGESSDAEIATLFASFLRTCNVRTRLIVNIPTPLADDVEIFSRKESAGRVMSFGLEIVRMLTGGGKTKTTNTTNGGSSTDPIELSDGVGAMPGSVEEIREKNEAFRNPAFFFVEALCEEERKWVSLDPYRNLFDRPEGLEQGLKKFWSDHPRKVNILKEARGCVSYVVGVEGGGDTEPLTVTDVTRRYAASYTTTQTLRVGDGDHWFSNFVKGLCGGGVVDLTDEGEEDKFGAGVENLEKVELEARVVGEKPPKSKEGFRNHPKFALKSQLKVHEVLKPNATKKSGMFSGEFIYRREDVSVARSAKKWLYEGRCVKASEMGEPVKKVKKKTRGGSGGGVKTVVTSASGATTTMTKTTNNKFTALKSYNLDIEGTASSAAEQRRLAELDASTTAEHGQLSSTMLNLYGFWQTEKYVLPYIDISTKIPKNEYGNIELSLMNPGLAHVPIRGLARAARKLGIDYAPCLTGFDQQTGNPLIEGIVVHEQNVFLIKEAGKEVQYWKEKEYEGVILGKWKRVVRKLIIGERLKEEYL